MNQACNLKNYNSIKILIIIISLSIVKSNLIAQSISNYNYSSSSGSYTTPSGSSFPSFSSYDNAYVNNINIGFDYLYMGQKYYNVGISINGWTSFGTITDATFSNLFVSGGPVRFWLHYGTI
ncbi:MAG: hypothetical protein WCK02_00860 [Bacteroidota bacterium]